LTLKGFLVGLAKRTLLLLALVLTTGVSALLTMRAILSSQEVAVPRLVDQRLADARAEAARHLLLLKVEGRRPDARIAAGRIAAQEPEPGAAIKTQRSVRVWLSVGPQRIRVPAVVGQSLRGARLAFEQAQLPVEHVVEVNDAAPEGTVVVQRPPAGETDEVAGGVALLVSRGPTGGSWPGCAARGSRSPTCATAATPASRRVSCCARFRRPASACAAATRSFST
jgi:serine/threonine-protein kinase